ncbi:hypothetical protein P3S67_009211 [Capsicum chacoense]
MIARGYMLIWRKNLVKLDCLRNDALLHSVSSVSSDKAVLHRYIATIDGAVHKRHLIDISEGTVIEGVHCTPDNVELLPRQPDLPRPRPRIVIISAFGFYIWFYYLVLLSATARIDILDLLSSS